MGYEANILEYLKTLKIGDIITTKKLKETVHNLYGTCKGSIIPSDYCYNVVNRDPRSNDFKNGHPRILEQVKKGVYKYLGPNYPYNGSITYKGRTVGYWQTGKYFLWESLDT